MATYALPLHHHGKSKVRLGRVWRDGNVHHMVEWNVNTMIDSDMEHAFLNGDNTGMTATDTQKNTVYVVAQRMSQKCTIEQYAIALAQHFVRTYPLVSKAKIYVEQKPWTRVQQSGLPHDHGFALQGTEVRTVYVTYDKAGTLDVTAGLKDLSLLKTTQSGYEGFLRDQYTLLPETNDRIMASTVTCTWKYAAAPACYDAAYAAAKQGLLDAFLGPARGGVYSPSVQYTLYDMAKNILDRVPTSESIFLNMPNLHFIPCNPVGSSFNNDVYVATSEPHGNIEAVITRKGIAPHCKL
ncbi:hypothetical protein CHLRE_12g504950v5 [Chlamydomonas reinhardtii]|uniref:Uricase n=1 Tax=Chlamydomonas reinhardtii TaxID=3055 RepID=A0A2K3D311_CHLRE|nr:uncharacterized protein CHLRE_12g504950v5 [Chlamydomonas reinhardtii]PNW74909.1 hypothetical protein CHLRE_12g504950v5 [Chlamydomonas reinhardtii]